MTDTHSHTHTHLCIKLQRCPLLSDLAVSSKPGSSNLGSALLRGQKLDVFQSSELSRTVRALKGWNVAQLKQEVRRTLTIADSLQQVLEVEAGLVLPEGRGCGHLHDRPGSHKHT